MIRMFTGNEPCYYDHLQAFLVDLDACSKMIVHLQKSDDGYPMASSWKIIVPPVGCLMDHHHGVYPIMMFTTSEFASMIGTWEGLNPTVLIDCQRHSGKGSHSS